MDTKYQRQKLIFYFDENFPEDIIYACKNIKWWKKRCKTVSVFDEETQNRDDRFHYNYCKQKNYILVTMDSDFWNDKKYPIMKLPGILIIDTSRNDFISIMELLIEFSSFIAYFPFPKKFIGDSKFKISPNKFIMKGRDAKTRKIKVCNIKKGNTVEEIGKKFNYFD